MINHLEINDTQWSKLAYTLYATNPEYLCNALMAFESLQRLESKAARVLMYPSTMSPLSITPEGNLLQLAKNEYNVQLVPVKIQKKNKIYCKLSLSSSVH